MIVFIHDLYAWALQLWLCVHFTSLNLVAKCDLHFLFQFQTCGDILFSLTYKPDVHKINGIILKATGLQKQDITGAAGLPGSNVIIILL